MDIVAGEISERVVFQIGFTTYIPKNGEWFRFETIKQFKKRIESSRVIVSHGGAGSIIHTLVAAKPLIVFPRSKKYGEKLDEASVELAEALKNEKLIYVTNDTDNLKRLLLDKDLQIGKVNNEERHILQCVITAFLKQIANV
jgi:UDP-N-acetylglucosamine transferase subunit ALG13